MDNWINIEKERPPMGMEVIAFNHRWIDNNLNLTGTGVGCFNDNNEFVFAYRWNTKDEYISVINSNFEPEYWMYMPMLDM